MIDTTKYTQLLILKRHWGLAATVALTVVAVVIPVAMGLPNVYRAGAKLTVERQASSTAAQTAIAGGLETRLQIIRQDALSRGRIISLIDDLDLYPELRRKASLDVVIDRVQKDISVVPQTVSVGNGSQVTMSFTVGYVGNKPEMVAAVTNRLASFWVEQNSTLRTQEVSQTLLGLKAQMEEAQSRLTDANGKMQAYMLRNAAQLPEAVIAKMQQLGRVNENLLQKSGYVTQLDFQRGNLQA